MKNIQSIRREYGQMELLEQDVASDPIKQFELWFEDVLEEKIIDPTAMVLATVDENGNPDTRVVLLKNITEKGLVFFTNYNSPKAIQAEKRGVVAVNFYWRELSRQVRVKGNIQRISSEESAAYFASRPRDSQISSAASLQSSILKNRDELEQQVQRVTQEYQERDIPCPTTWGGYCIIPFEFEFYQGRDNRLSDRIRYRKVNEAWIIERLSP